MSIYNRAALLEAIEKGEVFEYLLFYGHKASTDGSITASCCSQWFPAPFKIDDVEYLTAEHYMMAAKARLFNDSEMLENILTCQTPKEAKAFGRKVRNFESDVWKKHCTQIVVAANHAKFTQNPAFAGWLVGTAPKVLVEASLWDQIWGIGMAQSNPKALDPSQWKGQNLLGFALMQVRDQLSKID
jgi:ribA/ribD-fused uncharacterized protein